MVRTAVRMGEFHDSFQFTSWTISIEVHMDDIHGAGPRLALDLVQTNHSQKKSVSKIWSEWSGHEVRSPQA